MNRQWHTDFSLWDSRPKTPIPTNLDAIFRALDGQQANAQQFFQILADFIFIKIGRPRWFLDADITQILLHSQIESQSLQGISFPYDSFNLVFENGITLSGGYEIKFISICNPRSALAIELGGDAMRAFGKKFNNHSFEDSFYIGAVVTRAGADTVTLSVLPLSMPIKEGVEIINKPENVVLKANLTPELSNDINDDVVKIAVAAILYFNARPDLYVAQQLSRDQRYRFPGNADDRKNMRRVLLPMEKTVRPVSSGPTGTGASKRPHYRGFVLRTLRDERFQRNPDGSFKTVLVEPTVIHPELMIQEPPA